MYKIGEFSKVVDMPVRTLRYYDEINVLKPNVVDPFSGYRYYTEDNISEANLVKLLREVGFTLEEIIMYKYSLTSEVLENKKRELLSYVDEIREKIDKLDIISEEIEKAPVDNVVVLKKSLDTMKRVA